MNTAVILEHISKSFALHSHEWKKYLSVMAQEVEDLLDNNNLHATIKFRVKTLESLSEKRSFLSRSGEDNPEIKDLLGLRVILPFQEEVEHTVALLLQHYNTREIERKSENLSFREFAYDSIHLEVPVHEDLKLPPGCRPVIEVQVRTILQDAWAEVEHELIYKNHLRFPNNDSIRKKLAAVNASLSLADMIFQEIRTSQKEMAQWGRKRFKAMLDKAGEGFPDSDTDVEQQTSAPQATLPGIESPAAGNRAVIERNLMAALKAHNEKDYKTAIQRYSEVLECNPDLPVRSVVYSHRGMAYFMMHQESQALSDFDRSYRCDKNNYRSLNYRGMILRRMGYVEQALESFTSSLDIMPQQAEVYFMRAQTLAEVAQYDKASLDLDKTLEIDPEHAEALSLKDKITNSPD